MVSDETRELGRRTTQPMADYFVTTAMYPAALDLSGGSPLVVLPKNWTVS